MRASLAASGTGACNAVGSILNSDVRDLYLPHLSDDGGRMAEYKADSVRMFRRGAVG